MNEHPLHYCVFQNDFNRLKILLNRNKDNIDQKDLHGKTALELAILLEHNECAKVLVEFGADCNVITRQGWNLLQEAVSTGNVELTRLIMKYRNYQRTLARTNGIPEILNKLKQAPDFYVEMKWEFTSWIPLVAKACPSDVYKVYKSGSNVRIDTTLVGFNGTSWERGDRSYIFQANNDGATITELDHLTNSITTDHIRLSESDALDCIDEPNIITIESKLKSPNMTTYLDIEKIEFERNRSGIWGWRSDKIEQINGYECKVYTANNLQLVTKTRTEHLSEIDKAALQNNKDASNLNLPSFLSTLFVGNEQTIKTEKRPNKITIEQYFQKHANTPDYLDRSIEENKKTQTFNANLSLCEDYPLSLHEQLLPIVDLMALNNSHFKKLKEFITLQLPSGFPVKIEIPLYRVITAKVTFGNIHGTERPVPNVNTVYENKKPMSLCNERLFAKPPSYNEAGASLTPYTMPVDEEDILLQLAIQQSLSNSKEPFDGDEKLTALEMFGYRQQNNNYNNRITYDAFNTRDEDMMLQRALAESLMINPEPNASNFELVQSDSLYDIEKALELSKKEEEQREHLKRQEEDELERILQLSLLEK